MSLALSISVNFWKADVMNVQPGSNSVSWRERSHRIGNQWSNNEPIDGPSIRDQIGGKGGHTTVLAFTHMSSAVNSFLQDAFEIWWCHTGCKNISAVSSIGPNDNIKTDHGTLEEQAV